MAHTRTHIKRERAQSRAYSQAVITEGGRIVWLAGQIARRTPPANRSPAISTARCARSSAGWTRP
jgi:enamine deaminase RidA (YjgF/YER057c/UK114 family)